MSSFGRASLSLSAATQLTISELALAADLAAWAQDDDRCIGLIEMIYVVADQGCKRGASPRAMAMAADAALWVGDRHRCAENISAALELAATKHRTRTTTKRAESQKE